jgi:hypothetical protein
MDVKRGYYLSAEYLIGRHMQMLKSKCAGMGRMMTSKMVVWVKWVKHGEQLLYNS